MKLIICCLFLSASTAYAQSGCTLEDFETFNPSSAATILQVPFLDSHTVWNGQGPGLVEGGCSYWTTSSLIEWNNPGQLGAVSKGLRSKLAPRLTLSYTVPVSSVRIDLSSYNGYPDTANVTAFDVGGAVVDSVTGIAVVNSTPVTVSLAAAGISWVDVDGTMYTWSPRIDNHEYCTPAVPVPYCTAGTSTNGCVPTISSTGTPSISATLGFVLNVANVEGQKQSLFFYGVTGRAAAPWGASSSFLCVKAPTQRMPGQNTGGTTGACDGMATEDWLAYLASHPLAVGQPFTAGVVVDAQLWYRDPPSPKTTNLSDALEFVVQP